MPLWVTNSLAITFCLIFQYCTLGNNPTNSIECGSTISNLKNVQPTEQFEPFGIIDDCRNWGHDKRSNESNLQELKQFDLDSFLENSDNGDNLPIPDIDGGSYQDLSTLATSPLVDNNKNTIEDIVTDGGCVSQVQSSRTIQMPNISDQETCKEEENLASLIPMFGCILMAIIYRFFFV